MHETYSPINDYQCDYYSIVSFLVQAIMKIRASQLASHSFNKISLLPQTLQKHLTCLTPLIINQQPFSIWNSHAVIIHCMYLCLITTCAKYCCCMSNIKLHAFQVNSQQLHIKWHEDERVMQPILFTLFMHQKISIVNYI